MRKFLISERGFSIVEALIVAAIVGIMGVILTDLLSRTINGGSKTELLNTVKQNGQVALNIITDTIRQSSQVVCTGVITGTNEQTIVLIENGGQYGRFHYIPPALGVGGSNGRIDHELLVNPSDPTKVPDSDPTLQSDHFCLNQAAGDFKVTSPSTLTDNNTLTGISVSNTPVQPIFQPTSISGYPDVVKVDLLIKAGVSAGADYTTQIGDPNGIDFSTSVQLI